MKNKKKKVCLLVVVIVIIAIIAGLILYKNSDAVKVRKQLDLGQKYLSELEYDQAVAVYEAAIEIEPMNVDAYLGLADAYIGKGDYEAAVRALQKGYDLTQDENLINKLMDMNEGIENKRQEAEWRIAEENNFLEQSDEELDFVSLEEFVEAPTVAGENWRDWTPQRFIDYYGVEVIEDEDVGFGQMALTEEIDAIIYLGDFGNFGYEFYRLSENEKVEYGDFNIDYGNAYGGRGGMNYTINEALWISMQDWQQLNGFSSYLQKYQCFSIEELLIAWGMDQVDPAMVEAAQTKGKYYKELMTEYGISAFTLENTNDYAGEHYRLTVSLKDDSNVFGQFISVFEYNSYLEYGRSFAIQIDE